MSNDNQEQVNESIETQGAEQQEVNQEIDVKALMAEMDKLRSTNERLLNESKQNKAKYQGLRTEVDSRQQKSLEENEQWKELLEIEKNKSFEVQEQMKSMKQKVLQSNLHAEVAKHAKNAFDVNDVVSNLQSKKDMLNIDEENLRVDGIKEAVEIVMKEKPYLFNTGTKSHGMGQGPGEEYKPETKELTLEEALLQGFEKKII